MEHCARDSFLIKAFNVPANEQTLIEAMYVGDLRVMSPGGVRDGAAACQCELCHDDFPYHQELADLHARLSEWYGRRVRITIELVDTEEATKQP